MATRRFYVSRSYDNDDKKKKIITDIIKYRYEEGILNTRSLYNRYINLRRKFFNNDSLYDERGDKIRYPLPQLSPRVFIGIVDGTWSRESRDGTWQALDLARSLFQRDEQGDPRLTFLSFEPFLSKNYSDSIYNDAAREYDNKKFIIGGLGGAETSRFTLHMERTTFEPSVMRAKIRRLDEADSERALKFSWVGFAAFKGAPKERVDDLDLICLVRRVQDGVPAGFLIPSLGRQVRGAQPATLTCTEIEWPVQVSNHG